MKDNFKINVFYPVIDTTLIIVITIIIFMTIPVTSASVERSFSKLKLFKNYLRNSIGQDRLSNIAILNIERLQVDNINVDKIIEDFQI